MTYNSLVTAFRTSLKSGRATQPLRGLNMEETREEVRARFVAQVSNLLYRRFPIGRASELQDAFGRSQGLQAGSLRYSRLETCATPKAQRTFNINSFAF